MDKFVTVTRQKDFQSLTPTQVQYIHRIRLGTKLCVFGDSGVGKTFLVKKALEGTSFIEVTSKMDFSETTATLLFDDSEQHEETVSQGRQIVISRKKLENFPEYLEILPLPDNEMLTIAHKFFDGDIDTDIIKKARGNIRNFLINLDFSDSRDEFPTPKDFITSLMCRDQTLDPCEYIGHVIPEHGYSCGIVHENYLDASTNVLGVAEWLSLADIQDENIYHGSGTDTILFSLFGIVVPAIYVNHTIKGELRPGSAWTKFNNFKMREKRFASMTNRKIRATMDIDALTVLSTYCTNGNPSIIEKLRYYGLDSVDVDIMNHLVFHKIKSRQLLAIKKQLKSVG